MPTTLKLCCTKSALESADLIGSEMVSPTFFLNSSANERPSTTSPRELEVTSRPSLTLSLNGLYGRSEGSVELIESGGPKLTVVTSSGLAATPTLGKAAATPGTWATSSTLLMGRIDPKPVLDAPTW